MKQVIISLALFLGILPVEFSFAQEVVNRAEDGKEVYTTNGEVSGSQQFSIDTSPAYDPYMSESFKGEEPVAPTVSSSSGPSTDVKFNADAYNQSDPFMGHTYESEQKKEESFGQDLHAGEKPQIWKWKSRD
ncbi:MAG: hypothetical protein PHO70_06665 [Candidatus Omnitrophica bacterium]|nr:hypothetical protein [Candidatus Omnitrophota bacterium]